MTTTVGGAVEGESGALGGGGGVTVAMGLECRVLLGGQLVGNFFNVFGGFGVGVSRQQGGLVAD